MKQTSLQTFLVRYYMSSSNIRFYNSIAMLDLHWVEIFKRMEIRDDDYLFKKGYSLFYFVYSTAVLDSFPKANAWNYFQEPKHTCLTTFYVLSFLCLKEAHAKKKNISTLKKVLSQHIVYISSPSICLDLKWDVADVMLNEWRYFLRHFWSVVMMLEMSHFSELNMTLFFCVLR